MKMGVASDNLRTIPDPVPDVDGGDAAAMGVCVLSGCGFTKGGLIVVPDGHRMQDKAHRLTWAVEHLCDVKDWDWTYARDNRTRGRWWIEPRGDIA